MENFVRQIDGGPWYCFFDASGSTVGFAVYQKAVDMVLRSVQRGSLFAWGSALRSVSGARKFCDLGNLGGTSPELVAEHLVRMPQEARRYVLITTDGYVDERSVAYCRETLQRAWGSNEHGIEHLVFMVEGNRNAKDISVFQPFAEFAKHVRVCVNGNVEFDGEMRSCDEFVSMVDAIESRQQFLDEFLVLQTNVVALRTKYAAKLHAALQRLNERIKKSLQIARSADDRAKDVDLLHRCMATGDVTAYAAHVHKLHACGTASVEALQDVATKLSTLFHMVRDKTQYDMNRMRTAAAQDALSVFGTSTSTSVEEQQDVLTQCKSLAPLTRGDERYESFISCEMDVPCVSIASTQGAWLSQFNQQRYLRNQCIPRLLTSAMCIESVPNDVWPQMAADAFGSVEGYNAIRAWMQHDANYHGKGEFDSRSLCHDPLTRKPIVQLLPLVSPYAYPEGSKEREMVRTLQCDALRHLFTGRQFGSPSVLLVLLLHILKHRPEMQWLANTKLDADERVTVLERLAEIARDYAANTRMRIGMFVMEDLPQERYETTFALLTVLASDRLAKYFDPWTLPQLAATLLDVFPECGPFAQNACAMARRMQYKALVTMLQADTNVLKDAERWALLLQNDNEFVDGTLYAVDDTPPSDASLSRVFVHMPPHFARCYDWLEMAVEQVKRGDSSIPALLGEPRDRARDAVPQRTYTYDDEHDERYSIFTVNPSTMLVEQDDTPRGHGHPAFVAVMQELVLQTLRATWRADGAASVATLFADMDALRTRYLVSLAAAGHNILPRNYERHVTRVLVQYAAAYQRSDGNVQFEVERYGQTRRQRARQRAKRLKKEGLLLSAACNSRKARKVRNKC